MSQRLRLVIIQETAGVWLVRGLEHDVVVEGPSIGIGRTRRDRFCSGPHRLRQASRSDAALRLSSRTTELLECIWRRDACGAQSAWSRPCRLDGKSTRPSPTVVRSPRDPIREQCNSDRRHFSHGWSAPLSAVRAVVRAVRRQNRPESCHRAIVTRAPRHRACGVIPIRSEAGESAGRIGFNLPASSCHNRVSAGFDT